MILSLLPFQDILHNGWGVGDNVGHNVACLDGRNSFHGMGLIATPCGLERRQTTKTILRLKKVKSSELVAGRGIPIRSYVLPLKDPLTQLKFKPVMQLIRPCIIQKSILLSLIWHAMGMFRSLLERRPNWSGFMQSVSEGTHPLPSETLFLPIIGLKSTDESCIYSTFILYYIILYYILLYLYYIILYIIIFIFILYYIIYYYIYIILYYILLYLYLYYIILFYIDVHSGASQ